MAVLATPLANIGIFSIRRRASSVQAMVYSASVSIGGTYLRFDTRILQGADRRRFSVLLPMSISSSLCTPIRPTISNAGIRSEEHTSELQSLRHLVCRLLLEN